MATLEELEAKRDRLLKIKALEERRAQILSSRENPQATQDQPSSTQDRNIAPVDTSFGRRAGQVAREVIADVPGGVAELAALPYNIGAIGSNAAFDTKLPIFSPTRKIKGAFDTLTNNKFAPQTSGERVAEAAAEGLLPVVTGAGAFGAAAGAARQAVPALQKILASALGSKRASELVKGIEKGGEAYGKIHGAAYEPTVANAGASVGASVLPQAYQEQTGEELGPGASIGLSLVGAPLGEAAAKLGQTGAKKIAGLAKTPAQVAQSAFSQEIEKQGRINPQTVKNVQEVEGKLPEGVDFTLSETTQHPEIRKQEDTAANSGAYAKYSDFNEKRAKKLLGEYEKIAQTYRSGAPQSREKLGKSLSEAAKKTTDQLKDTLYSEGRRDFEAVLGPNMDNHLIPVDNFIGAVDKQIKRFEKSSSPARASASQELKALKGRIETAIQSGKATPDWLQEELSVYGGASADSGNILKELNTAQNKYVSRRFFDALNKDLDSAVKGLGEASEAGAKLKFARDNYRKNYQATEGFLKEHLIKGFGVDLNKTPEDIVKHVLSMEPSEATRAVEVINQYFPDELNNLRAFVITDALNNAKNPRGSAKAKRALPEGELTSKSKESQLLNTSISPNLVSALFEGDKEALDNLLTLNQAVDIIATQGARQSGSPTAQREATGAQQSKSINTGNWIDAAKQIAKRIFGKYDADVISLLRKQNVIASISMDKELRDKFIKGLLTKDEVKKIDELSEAAPLVGLSKTAATGIQASERGKKKDVELQFYKPGEKKPFSEKLP